MAHKRMLNMKWRFWNGIMGAAVCGIVICGLDFERSWGQEPIIAFAGVSNETVVAGNGTPGVSGEGGLAVSAQIASPRDLFVDSEGNLYINHGGVFINESIPGRLSKVDAATGIITTVVEGFKPPDAVAVDGEGNIFLFFTGSIEKIDPSGNITLVTGRGRGFSGDGGPASEAIFDTVTDLAIDGAGNIFVADSGNMRIRKIDTSGIVTTIGGNGESPPYSSTEVPPGDGGPATATSLDVRQIFADKAGNVFVTSHGRIRKIDTEGNLSTLPAVDATGTITGDDMGNFFFGTETSCPSKLVAFSPTGRTSVLKETSGCFDDNYVPFFDAQNNQLYVADKKGHQIIRLDVTFEEATVEEEVGRGGRFPDAWKLDRTVNLGPKAGNAVSPHSIEVDRSRNRVFIGAENIVSIVSLQLNQVTGILELPAVQLGNSAYSLRLANLALSESRNELYGIGLVAKNQILIWDLNTLSITREIALGKESTSGFVVNGTRGRLYLGNATSLTAVDLQTGEVLTETTYGTESQDWPGWGKNDFVLGREDQFLYAKNYSDKSIDVIDLDDFQVKHKIQLDDAPSPTGRLIVDPQQSHLYVITEKRNGYNHRKILRIDLTTNTVDREVDFGSGSSSRVSTGELEIELDGNARKLWVMYTAGSFGGYYTIDLEDFSLGKPVSLPISGLKSLKISPDGKDILVLSYQSLLYRVSLPSGSIDAVIETGSAYEGIAVSEGLNQVYIGRGTHVGFSVFDAVGDLIRTIKGTPFTDTGVVLVDEVSDRLFLSERNQSGSGGLAAYELSTLRRLKFVGGLDVYPITGGKLRADHQKGVLWDWENGVLNKLDLLTGIRLATFHVDNFEYASQGIQFDPNLDKVYVGARGKGIGIFDTEAEQFVSTVDVGQQGALVIPVALDRQRYRLYLLDLGGGLLVWDNYTEEIVFSEPDFNFNGRIVLDIERGKGYMQNGKIIDLETFDTSQRFMDSTFPHGEIALNRVTNTIYLMSERGLSVFLGPAGTEAPSPPVPIEVKAESGDEEIVLSWPAVDDPSLIGYHVYRRDRADVDFVRITQLPLAGTAFTDVDLTNGQTYTYSVQSVGQKALLSDLSEAVAGTPTGGGNFSLVMLRKSVSAARGDSVSLPMSIEPLEGFDEEVMLSIEAPEGLEVVFSPAQFALPRIVEVKIRVATDAPVGRSELVLQGEGGDKVNTAEIVLEVTEKVLEQSVLTLELDQEEVPLDIPLLLNGRLFPGTQTQVQLDFRAERADTLISMMVDTDKEGGYRAPFLAPFTDKWNVSASWAGNDDFEGAQSRAVEFRVTSGKTRITATSDLADDADLGWIATVKGRIYPSPGTVGVTLNVRKPDGSEEKIEGLLASAEGFYGHDLRMDQQGLWELWASWKGNDRLLGAASSVITVPVGADVGRVLLVACGQDSPRDIFWPTSNYLANLAYTTFQKRRLLKEKVFYLNDRQDQDVDRDGFMEDVDGSPTMAEMGDAWDWVKERVNVDNPLFVYLVGKGTPMGLEVSPGEVLTATQLGEWLDEVESSTGTSATLIVEAAHAGNFIRDLSSQGRKVIGSTGPGLAFYQAEGYLSFSQYFLTDLYQGKSLQEAFLHTHNILRNLPGGFRDQRPGLEAEGNIITNQPGDYLQTMDSFIGAPFELGDLSPQIKASSLSSVAGGAGKRIVTQTVPISEDGLGPRLKLARPVAEQGVEISARIDDAEGNLKVVRAMIIPPASDSLSSLTEYPEVELSDDDGDGTWVGVSHEFLEEGVYPVIIYAIDGAGNAAEPLRTTVLVEPPPPLPTGDFNGDGLVDFADFFMFADAFGGDDPAYDLDQSGQVDFADFFLFADAFGGPLGKLLELAEEMLVLPESYALGVPYPNPFNSEVVVKYTLPRESEVEVVVYNTLGQVVRRLVEGHRRLGHHRVVWDGRDGTGRELATGTYLVQMRAGEWRSDASRPADLRFRQVHKIAVIK